MNSFKINKNKVKQKRQYFCKSLTKNIFLDPLKKIWPVSSLVKSIEETEEHNLNLVKSQQTGSLKLLIRKSNKISKEFQKTLNRADFYMIKGINYYKSRNYKKAVVMFIKAGKISKPYDINAVFNIALTYSRYDNKKAIKYYWEYLREYDNFNINAWNNLGNCYSALGDTHTAKKCYLTAIAVNKKFNVAKLNLGLLLLRTGDFNKINNYLIAAEYFRKISNIRYYHIAMGVYYQFLSIKSKNKTEKLSFLKKSLIHTKKTKTPRMVNLLLAQKELFSLINADFTGMLQSIKNAAFYSRKAGYYEQSHIFIDQYNTGMGLHLLKKGLATKSNKKKIKLIGLACNYLIKSKDRIAFNTAKALLHTFRANYSKSKVKALLEFKEALKYSILSKEKNTQIMRLKTAISFYQAVTSKGNKNKHLHIRKALKYAKKIRDISLIQQIYINKRKLGIIDD